MSGFPNLASNRNNKHQDSQGYRRQDVVWGGVGMKTRVYLRVLNASIVRNHLN